MTEDELELKILERFVARHDEAAIADPERQDKCARELDMREVLRELTGKTGPALEADAHRWLLQLAPGHAGTDRGPLRLCSSNQDRGAAHRYHARSFLDPNSIETSAWNRIRALKKELGVNTNTTSTMAMTNTIRLFISHASDDVALAARVVALFRAALNLPASAIRCTSVDGHRLEGGADTDEAIRNEIGSAEAFVGILSNRSVRSAYVLIELGGRWVLNKHLLPLLAPGTPPSVLGGPLAGKNALRADSEAQLHQMVYEVASVLQVKPEPTNVYLQQIRDVKEWKPTADTEQRLVIRPFTPDPEVAKSSEQLKIAADLSPSETELLKAAVVDPKAMIMKSRTNNTGTSIKTNGKNFVETGNPRSEAEWEGALKGLAGRGLVLDRRGTGEIFYVTDAGFRIADLIVIA